MSETANGKQQDSELAVYADLVRLYPDNEGYLRKYADLLLEVGQLSTAREILQHLHQQLLDKGQVERANRLVEEYPLIGRVRAIEEANSRPILELLPDEMQSRVWQFMHQQRLKEGQHLFRQGEPGDTMYLLLKGELAIFITPRPGETILLNLVQPGQVVGEGCLLDPGVRNADVVANKDSVVVKLPRKKIIAAIIENPGLEAELRRISDFRFMNSLLAGNPLLSRVPLAMRQDMALDTVVRHYPEGRIIHQAGDELDAVDMLIRGKAAYCLHLGSERHVLLDLVPGEMVGDTSAVRKSSCPADLVALSAVTMAHIPYSAFKNIVEAYPPLKEGLMNHAESQREMLMRKVAGLKKRT